MSSAAIVTTLKSQGPSLVTFVNYHLNLGFKRIYLMFDDPTDPDQELVSNIDGVTAIPVDDNTKKQWESLSKFERYGQHTGKEKRARQTLNAQLGLMMAMEEGIDWILHIDADELFWPGRNSLDTHLDTLIKDEVIAVRYFNFEAVPSTHEIGDYFLEVNAFKKPRKLLEKLNIDLSQHWQEKRKYFNFYNNGKSMCRVREDMVPNDVHKWRSRQHYIKTARYYYPCILHYSCCGYNFFKKKYQLVLANGFDGTVFGKSTLKERGFTMDYNALMAYKNGEEERGREIYANHVMLDEERVQHYCDLKIIERIDVPGRMNDG